MNFEIVWIADGYECSNTSIHQGPSMGTALLNFEEMIRRQYPEIKILTILSARLLQ